MYEITFHVTKNIHGRYKRLSKSIQSMGMDVSKVVPNFFIDLLEIDKTEKFSQLKKYIGGK